MSKSCCFMSRLSATTALAPTSPGSLAIVLKRCTRSISRSFMVAKGRAGCVQEQYCLSYRFQVIITNSPQTGCDSNGRGKFVIGLMAGNDRKVAPVVSDPSAGRVGFRASSDGWTSWRLSNGLTILDESGQKGVYFAYTPLTWRIFLDQQSPATLLSTQMSMACPMSIFQTRHEYSGTTDMLNFYYWEAA